MLKGTEELIKALPYVEREYITGLGDRLGFTESTLLEVVKDELDLRMWEKGSVREMITPEDEAKGRGACIAKIRKQMEKLRKDPIDYSDFLPDYPSRKHEVVIEEHPIGFGKCPCPVDGEKTRCCKLTTLDLVMQCAFSCSYCSVRSFYDERKIIVPENAKEKLLSLEIPENVWHIGTGQASDSLFLGNDYESLDALEEFAKLHPEMVIELKSKSGRCDIFDHKYPGNMVFTWSLNGETVVRKEEHLTASLEKRIEAAKAASENGSLVGFHIHPMVNYKGWEDEYRDVVGKITSTFPPSRILMISAGTLVFTKEVIKTMRCEGNPTRVLEMELTKSAGKYTYPLDVRRKLYTTLFSYFPKEYRDNVFMYLCLEDPSLWLPALGREYKNDSEFESDMKKHYMEKITSSSP